MQSHPKSAMAKQNIYMEPLCVGIGSLESSLFAQDRMLLS